MQGQAARKRSRRNCNITLRYHLFGQLGRAGLSFHASYNLFDVFYYFMFSLPSYVQHCAGLLEIIQNVYDTR